MLKRLRLQNFKNHVDTDLDGLGQLAVFVGVNGAGKSSVLHAVEVVQNLGGSAVKTTGARGLAPRHLDYVRMGSAGFQLYAEGDPQGSPWAADLSVPKKEQEWPGHLRVSWGDGPLQDYQKDETGGILTPELRAALGGAVYLRLEPSKLFSPSYPVELPPRVRASGFGLASAVSYLMRTEPELHRRLEEQLREVVPAVIGLRTQPVEFSRTRTHTLSLNGKAFEQEVEEKVIGDELLFDTREARGVRGPLQSGGTLIVLGILTALALPEAPRVVLIDDVEMGLHPGAQRCLMGLLRKLVKANPDLQILMTTHSPYVLDGLEQEEIWVLAAGENGPRARRLDQHPRAEEALRLLTTGEFWSMEGEAWAAESAP